MLRSFLFFILAAAPALALAHNSSVDKYGCHKDKRQGGYHCHSGALKGEYFASQQDMLKELHRRERQEETKRKRSPWESKS
jgi:hypothetical protein